jgi:hypothetical protein
MQDHAFKRLFPHAVNLGRILPAIRSIEDEACSLRTAQVVLPFDTLDLEKLLRDENKDCPSGSTTFTELLSTIIRELFDKEDEPTNVLAFGYRKSRPPHHNQVKNMPGVEIVFPNTTNNMLLDSTDWALLPDCASTAIIRYLFTRTLLFVHIASTDSYLQVCGPAATACQSCPRYRRGRSGLTLRALPCWCGRWHDRHCRP